MPEIKTSNNTFELKYDSKIRIVILTGKEPFLINQYTKQIEEILTKNFGSVDTICFDGKFTSATEVIDESRTWGLLGNHKFINVNNADELLKQSGAINPRPLFENYAKNPNNDSTLILKSETWRKGNLDKIVTASGGLIFRVPEITIGLASSWCSKRASSHHGISLSTNSAELLVQRVGCDLIKIDSELLKLSSYTTNGQIEEKDIRHLVEVSKEEEVWALQRAIASGSPSAALIKCKELQEISQQPEALITWAILDLLRKLNEASALIRKKVPLMEVKNKCKFWGPSGENMCNLSSKHTPDHFAKQLNNTLDIIKNIRKGDLSSKSGMDIIIINVSENFSIKQGA